MPKPGTSIAPHLLFPQFLNDADANERQLAVLRKRPHEHVRGGLGVGKTISRGMQPKIKRARWKNYRLRYFDENIRRFEPCTKSK